MPSASSKLEKQASSEAGDPLRQAITIIEHKIRNLEKRKGKLDLYKESGKPLTKEQVEAVSKYDGVVQQLELSREYIKQFNSIILENDKLRKKQARKEAQERFAADVHKIKQVLILQDVLQNMGSDNVREDFLAAKNGATQLTENDLKLLDDLYLLVSPKHGQEDGSALFSEQLQKAAEHILPIVEGRPKEVLGTTCAKIKQTLMSIHSCGYFDQTGEELSEAGVVVEADIMTETIIPDEEVEFQETQEIISNVVLPSHTQLPQQAGERVGSGVTTVQLQATVTDQSNTSNVPKIVPTPVSQVESSFFNAQAFKQAVQAGGVPPPVHVQQQQQQQRPLNSVITVTSHFNFLQESELETTELNPAQAQPAGPLPTRTFTNQTFNSQPQPPPPPQQTQGYPAVAAAMFGQSAQPTELQPYATNPPNPIPMPPTRNQINANSISYNQSSQPGIVPGFNTPGSNQTFQQQPGPQQQQQQVIDQSVDEKHNLESEHKSTIVEERNEWPTETGTWNGASESNEWNSDGNLQTDSHRQQGRPNNNNNNRGRSNGYSGVNRGRNNYSNNRQGGGGGGYRDQQSNSTSSNSAGSGYYQNQNGYRNNDRGDYNNGFRKGGMGGGSGNRNGRAPGDRGDRDRVNPGNNRNSNSGPRPPRNTNPRQGQNYNRQQQTPAVNKP